MTDQTPDPIDVEWTYWKHRSDGWSVGVVDDSGVVCIVPAASRDDLDAFATASRIATLLTRPDDATRQEVETLRSLLLDNADSLRREGFTFAPKWTSRIAELLAAAYLGRTD